MLILFSEIVCISLFAVEAIYQSMKWFPVSPNTVNCKTDTVTVHCKRKHKCICQSWGLQHTLTVHCTCKTNTGSVNATAVNSKKWTFHDLLGCSFGQCLFSSVIGLVWDTIELILISPAYACQVWRHADGIDLCFEHFDNPFTVIWSDTWLFALIWSAVFTLIWSDTWLLIWSCFLVISSRHGGRTKKRRAQGTRSIRT